MKIYSLWNFITYYTQLVLKYLHIIRRKTSNLIRELREYLYEEVGEGSSFSLRIFFRNCIPRVLGTQQRCHEKRHEKRNFISSSRSASISPSLTNKFDERRILQIVSAVRLACGNSRREFLRPWLYAAHSQCKFSWFRRNSSIVRILFFFL